MRADSSFFYVFCFCFLFFFLSFFERLVLFFFTTRNLTGIVSVKKASIKGKSTVELTEEEAAVVVQKGRTNINKMFDERKGKKRIFDEPD